MANKRYASRSNKSRTRTPRKAMRVAEEEPVDEKSFWEEWSQKPASYFVLFIVLIFLSILPLCTITETIQKKETVMVPVQTQVETSVPGQENVSVYQGYICDAFGTVITIDAVDGIVRYDKAIGPPIGVTTTWVLTLTNLDGQQVIYRDITTIDLTRTGKTTTETETTSLTPNTQMVPQQVTTEEEVQSHVNFWKWAFGDY